MKLIGKETATYKRGTNTSTAEHVFYEKVLAEEATEGGFGDPDKMWKFSAADVAERRLWDKYQDVYEDMIRNTATEHAPWYVVPCNKKWFARLVVAAVLSEHIKALDPSFPKMSTEDAAEIDAAHKELLDEKD